MGSPLPHLTGLNGLPTRSCVGTRLTPPTSAPGLNGLTPAHICAGTEWAHPRAHLHSDLTGAARYMIIVEMLVAALLHGFIFSYRDFLPDALLPTVQRWAAPVQCPHTM